MKKILFVIILTLCAVGFHPTYDNPALAAETAVEKWQQEEPQILTVLKEKIAVTKAEEEKNLATFILKRIKGEIGEGITNPVKRKEYYDEFMRILAVSDEAKRLPALKKLGQKLGKKPEDDVSEDDQATKDKELALKAKQDQCIQSGGSWSYSAESCTSRNSNNTGQGQGSVNQGGGSSGGGSSGGGSSGGGGGNPFGGDNGGGGGAPSFPTVDSGPVTPFSCPAKPSKCGPSWDRRDLPKDMTADQRAEICLGIAEGLSNAVNGEGDRKGKAGCEQADLEKEAEKRSGEDAKKEEGADSKEGEKKTETATAESGKKEGEETKSREEKTDDPQSCKALTMAAADTYKQAAGYANDEAKKKEICSKAKEKLKVDSSKWDECKPKKYPNSLAESRARFAEELKNPTVQNRLNSQIGREVGSQGQCAQTAYLESIMNRANARGKSLYATITDTGYYPAVSLRNNSTYYGRYNGLINQVITQGSNTCSFCTGNASGSVGAGKITLRCGGEKFGIESTSKDQNWAAKMMKCDN